VSDAQDAEGERRLANASRRFAGSSKTRGVSL